MDNLYNITKTAKLLGVNRVTIYDWHNKGKLKFIKVNGFNKVSETEIRRMRGEE